MPFRVRKRPSLGSLSASFEFKRNKNPAAEAAFYPEEGVFSGRASLPAGAQVSQCVLRV